MSGAESPPHGMRPLGWNHPLFTEPPAGFRDSIWREPVGDFPQFAKLPAELRHMIWRECLPRTHVAELDEPVTEVVTEEPPWLPSHCNFLSTTAQNAKLPLISRVCRESRQIVIDARCREIPWWEPDAPKDPSSLLPDCISETEGRWLRAGHDIAHLCYQPNARYMYQHGIHTRETNPVPFLDWVAKTYEPAEVCLSASIVHPWFNEQEDADVVWEYQTQILRSLEKRKRRYLLRLQTVVIHTSAADSARFGDGLFGRLGDAPVALVDPVNDWEDMKKARRLWKATGRAGSDANYFFRDMSSLRKGIEEWQELLEHAWMRYKWHRAKESGAPYSLRNIWAPDWEGCGVTTSDVDNGLFGKLRKERSWVRKQLSRIPEFRPVFMFRQCSDGCHLDADPPEARRNRMQEKRAREAGKDGVKTSRRREWYPPRVLLPPEMPRK